MLRWCEKVLLVVDNADSATEICVKKLIAEWGERLFVSRSPFPKATEEQEKEERGLYRRFRKIQGELRDFVFKEIRWLKIEPDYLLFLDSDEFVTNYFPTLMEDFIRSGKEAVAMRSVSPVGSYMTITDKTQARHVRLMRWKEDLRAVPYRGFCLYYPLSNQTLYRQDWCLVHLNMFSSTIGEWRERNWHSLGWAKRDGSVFLSDKPVSEMSPDEIAACLKGEPAGRLEES
jgi:hypothetical protein